MTNEQIQALLEKAESDDLALNGNEISNQLRHLADNEIDSDSFAVVTENYNGIEVEFERPITDLAIDAAEVIDALLAERAVDKALIAEQAKRIAELEASLKAAEINETDARCHVAELEARTLTVKLPRDITHVTNKYFEEGRDAVIEVIESQLAAAGITLVVGE